MFVHSCYGCQIKNWIRLIVVVEWICPHKRPYMWMFVVVKVNKHSFAKHRSLNVLNCAFWIKQIHSQYPSTIICISFRTFDFTFAHWTSVFNVYSIIKMTETPPFHSLILRSISNCAVCINWNQSTRKIKLHIADRVLQFGLGESTTNAVGSVFLLCLFILMISLKMCYVLLYHTVILSHFSHVPFQNFQVTNIDFDCKQIKFMHLIGFVIIYNLQHLYQ